MRFVIIGNGTAGLSAAEEIRKKDNKSEIVLITEEEYHTYYRIKLSEAISRDFSDKELFVKSDKWYEENKINVMLNTEVEKIDTKSKTVCLSNGGKLSYSKLLIATGSKSFVPPIKGSDKTCVFTLRSLKDLKKIRESLKQVKTVTILGGGLLGLEAAWAVSKLDKEVHVVEFSKQLLPRQLDEVTSAKFGTILNKKGLTLHLGVSAEEITGGENVDSVKLSDKSEIKTDIVIISAGVRPRLEVIEGTNIRYDKGILVDEFMKTSEEDVFAAGDVVEVNGQVIGLWNISSEQGRVAGKNMVGEEEKYEFPELTTMLNIADSSIFSGGDITDYDSTIDEDTEDNKRYRICLKDGKITGGIVFNDMAKASKIKKAIDDNIDVHDKLRDDITVLELIDSI